MWQTPAVHSCNPRRFWVPPAVIMFRSGACCFVLSILALGSATSVDPKPLCRFHVCTVNDRCGDVDVSALCWKTHNERKDKDCYCCKNCTTGEEIKHPCPGDKTTRAECPLPKCLLESYVDPVTCCQHCFPFGQPQHGRPKNPDCAAVACIEPECPVGRLIVPPGRCCPNCLPTY